MTAFGGFEVGLDSPFSGAYVPEGRAQAALMIEIRRDVHAAGEADLVAALAALVDMVTPAEHEPECGRCFRPRLGT